jgi:TonB family protein
MRAPNASRRLQPQAISANERLKQGWDGIFRSALGVAAIFHLLLFTFWPKATVELESLGRGSPAEMVHVGSAPEVRVPAPPEEVRIAAPQLPTVAPVEIDPLSEAAIPLPEIFDPALSEVISLVPTHANPDRWYDYEKFGPYLVHPRVRNEGEMRRFLERRYNPLLQVSGVTGVVMMSLWIDELGQVARAEISESSGVRALDRLAIQVSDLVRFSPALRLGQPVRVQVRMPIVFRST